MCRLGEGHQEADAEVKGFELQAPVNASRQKQSKQKRWLRTIVVR
jgi:hypothetical protein